MRSDLTAGILTRDRSGTEDKPARIEAVREALAEWRVACANRDDSARSEAVTGTNEEVAAAVEVLHHSLVIAIDRVREADIAAARDRGWLSADEAAAALKEKRLRELARLRGAVARDSRDRHES